MIVPGPVEFDWNMQIVEGISEAGVKKFVQVIATHKAGAVVLYFDNEAASKFGVQLIEKSKEARSPLTIVDKLPNDFGGSGKDISNGHGAS